jgi:hypothetical protein
MGSTRFADNRVVLDPFSVAQDVGINSSDNGVSGIATSDTGVLAYRASSSDRILSWVDRTGRSLGDVGETGSHENAALAPGGDRLVETRAQGDTGNL